MEKKNITHKNVKKNFVKNITHKNVKKNFVKHHTPE